jgi:hypothetical protein
MEEESKTDLDKEREELLIQVKRVMIHCPDPDLAFQVNPDPGFL